MRLIADGFKIIYDPIVVKIVERQLKRPLDEMEKAGEKSVYYNGRLVFLTVERVVFPHDLVPNVFKKVK